MCVKKNGYVILDDINLTANHGETLALIGKSSVTINVGTEYIDLGATAYDKGFERKNDKVNAKQVRYYQDIADKNRERYKKMLQMIKANREVQSNKFDSIKARVDNCFDRYTALISKMLKNPTKFSNYDLEWLNDKFSTYRSSKYSSYEYGLMHSFEKYVRFMLDAQKGNAYVSNRNGLASQIRQYEENIESDLLEVERKLAELEAK